MNEEITLYISTHLDKKQFKKLYKPAGCYFIELDDIELTSLGNVYQEFIFLQSVERIFNRVIRNKGITSVWCKVGEMQAECLSKSNWEFLQDVKKVHV